MKLSDLPEWIVESDVTVSVLRDAALCKYPMERVKLDELCNCPYIAYVHLGGDGYEFIGFINKRQLDEGLELLMDESGVTTYWVANTDSGEKIDPDDMLDRLAD